MRTSQTRAFTTPSTASKPAAAGRAEIGNDEKKVIVFIVPAIVPER
jgi:hypothetical protein